VVTNDTALARACRDLGATTHTASALAHRVLARPGDPGERRPPSRRRSPRDAADKPHPSGSDQAHWKAVFGGTDKDENDGKDSKDEKKT
jgi:aryl-alcohol dehydrogenase-like predicted oxidoreductase